MPNEQPLEQEQPTVEQEQIPNEEPPAEKEEQPPLEQEQMPNEQPPAEQGQIPMPQTTHEQQSQNNDKLTNALETLVDIFSDKIAEKVSQSTSNTPRTENGFNAVESSATTMGSSGGKNKIKKTRRFRLLKNKTKHAK